MKTEQMDVQQRCELLKLDTDRWTQELTESGARATLTIGVQKRAWSHAESLLMACARVFIRRSGDDADIGRLTGGKTTDLSKLTMGQVMELLQYWDSRKILADTNRVIGAADRKLLNRISTARNSFTHRDVHAEEGADEILQAIADVRLLADLRLVQLAVQFEGLDDDTAS